MVVALIALFFALGGAAGAATYAIVPLAKRALSADNAKKLSGKNLSQVVSQAAAEPGPASSVSDLVSYATGSITVPPHSAGHLDVDCPTGKAIAGGFDVPNSSALDVFIFHEGPVVHGSLSAWEIFLGNAGNSSVPLTGFAVCLA
jgi:hypothetical protein